MGLDIYLHRYIGERTYDEDAQEHQDHREFFYDLDSKVRREVAGEPKKVMKETPFGVQEMIEPLTEEQYEEFNRLLRLRQSQYIEQNNLHLRVGEYGVEVPEECIEIDSEKYPDHLFKIGYLRSSYNSGGFNTVVKQLVGHDLYWLFGSTDVDNYIVRPDWKTALVRCNVLIDQLKMDPGFNVVRCDLSKGFGFDLSQRIEEKESLKKFNEIRENADPNSAEDFCFDGFHIWPKGKQLLAVVLTSEAPVILIRDNKDRDPYAWMPKNGEAARQAMDIFNQKMEEYNNDKPKDSMIDFSSFSCSEGTFFLNGIEVRGMNYSMGCTGRCVDFIGYNPEGNEWYLQAAEITKEMIEWVLNQDNPQEYYFHWSG